MSNSILVALDGSSQAEAVLDAAVSLAKAEARSLLLMRAVGIPPELPLEAFSGSADGLLESMRAEADGYLLRMAKRVPAGVSVEREVVIGPAWEQICSVARARDVALVVIGAHGYRGLDRVFGTTAAKVVNHADRSVYVVRPRAAT